MRKGLVSLLPIALIHCGAFAVNEGVPVYYQQGQTVTTNQRNYGNYANQGYTKYVGQSGSKQVIGTRSRIYQQELPRIQETVSISNGITYGSTSTITTNGVAMPVASEHKTQIYGGYARRFSDFEFKTGVNSVLEWDDMIFNELTIGARHNFALRNFDLFAFGEYKYGEMDHGGLSMDYDLEPYSWNDPTNGIFTVSVGNQTGKTQNLRLGLGAYHIWDIAGWKISPIIGYEIFKHDLQMSDHLYPNPGVYLPLMTNLGDYVYGDANGNFFSMPTDITPPDNWYQVCMGPEDIKLVEQVGTTYGYVTQLGTTLTMNDYDPNMGLVPWGVDYGECVIIGGDGPIRVDGLTHVYNTTWSGFYFGLEIEKQMTFSDKLRLYFQVSLPNYSSEGIWPNRTDWQQNPSFLDEGSNGAYAYAAELEYNLRLSSRLGLSIKVDMNTFHVGNIPGELYIAGGTDFVYDENGQLMFHEVIDQVTGLPIVDSSGQPILFPDTQDIAPHTEYISNSLEHATWRSFGVHLNLKFAF